MKILLCNPPWIRDGIFGVRAGSRWPHFQEGSYLPFPFFLSYAAAVLKEQGHDVYLIDAIAERIQINDFLHRIKNICPDIILFETSTPSISDDIETSKSIRSIFPHKVQIVFCGLHYELASPIFLELNDHIDFILFGEYEHTLSDLVRTLSTSGDLNTVKGIIFRDKNGCIVKTQPRPLISDLDSLPWPLREQLPMKRYCDQPGGIPMPSLQIWASRGCPFKCIFCAWPNIMYGNNIYRVRNPVNVLDEIEWCIKQYGFRSVYFDDDTFNIGNERMLKICSEFNRRSLAVPWAIMARADTSTIDIFAEMKKSGLYALKFGVESGVQELVNNSGKNLDLKTVEKSVSACKSLGIKTHLTFMFGLPGETEKTIEKTINYAITLDPDSVQFSIATPFPGSPYYNLLEKQGSILSKDWSRYDGAKYSVIKTDCLKPADLQQAVITAYKEWTRHKLKNKYFSKRYLLKSIRCFEFPAHARG